MEEIKKESKKKYIKNFIFLFIGSMIYAAGIKMFLVPNGFIDGGITGISMITNYLTEIPTGIFILTINMPFIIVGYKFIGKKFAVFTMFSLVFLSAGIQIFENIPIPTMDFFLDAVFGGAMLGFGLGLIIRYGGCIDGTEIIAIIYDKKSGFTIGEIILFFNLFIMGVAGFIFGWERAMYSLVAYFVASKMIDAAIEGFNEAKAVMIISEKYDEISKKIVIEMGKGATIFFGKGGYKDDDKKIIYTIVKRLEITKIKEIVNRVDPGAFLTISGVHEVMNGRVRKNREG